jgi:hypothetical protein
MRIFPGRLGARCSDAATVPRIIFRSEMLPCLRTSRWTEFEHCGHKGSVMRSAKAIATLVSVTAIVGSLFAVSWIGLALLGF